MKTKEELILKELEEGKSKKDIAKEYGVSKSWLHRFSKKHGYVIKQPTKEELENSKKAIFDDYLNGYSYNELVEKHKYSKSAMARWLKDEGLTERKVYPKELKEKIIKEYLEGFDSIQLSKKYNLSSGTITGWLRERGLTRKRGPESLIQREDYFDEIDTEAKSYFLGLIMADGNTSIYDNQYSLKLSFEINDGHIIEDFLKEIKSTNATYNSEGNYLKKDGTFNKSKRVSLTSKYMVERLFELGVIPRKTGHEIFPEKEIEKRYHKDFFRGYFDGDGSVSITNRGYGRMNVTSASKKIIDSFLDFMNWKNMKVYFRNNAYIFYPNKKQMEEFYNKCYKNSSFHINRKKEMFDYIFEQNSPL